MIYLVTAQFNEKTGRDFLQKLTDGTVARQRPDGEEIVKSMQRAVVTEDGLVRWTEQCFCDPPLKHERQTVLDAHFDRITTQPVGEHRQFEGENFMDFLGRAP